ncbi:hypothetical protein DXX93_02930 [Thalassotalea euphylliae]|uniref:Alpha/beta hydrolase n=1 Tax=Thalassotalea euphylliae TaxID=1655234 RepID=A0A3E0TM57_9GAMM|nr:hypothetical protein [Thalassotalea euphylliae]REL25606.1 hypothetical protein DXX93_02930 [Thalassotalea euphylliae]
MIKEKLFSVGIKLLSNWFPEYAYTLVKRKLLIPNSSSARWAKESKRKLYRTKYGGIRTYTTGGSLDARKNEGTDGQAGNYIWLVHGGGNAHQFMPLIKRLVQQGYTCIAIEFLSAPSAQRRGEQFVSLPNWSNALDIATRYLPAPSHVITQGVGTSIVGNSMWLSQYQGKLTLVSPVLDFYQRLKQFIGENRLPNMLLARMEKEVFNNDRVRLKALSVTRAIDNFAGQLTVFYSQADGTSTVDEIHALSVCDNRKIVEFKGACTDRMIKSRSLFLNISEQAPSQSLSTAHGY